MGRAKNDRRGWLLALAGLLAYACLYDNANSWPSAMGYGWTRLILMPRQLRIGEIGIVAGLVGLALTHGVSRLTRRLLAGTFAFIGLAMLSYLNHEEVPLLDAVRLIYMWVLPLFIFIIGREGPFGRTAWKWVVTMMLVWVVVSAVASWVQFGVLRYPVGDDITGLNKDAHANGTLMMFTALQWLAFSLFRQRRAALPVSLFFLITMVLSSVLKVMFLGVLAVGLLVWLYVKSLPRKESTGLSAGVKWSVAAGVAVVLAGMAFTQIDVISSNRLGDFQDKLLNNPQSLGPLQAHAVAATKISGELSTLALGMGPFHFANPISVGQVLADGNLSRKASNDVLAIADEKGEQTRITLTSSLLAEFGVPAFLIIIVLYAGIGQAVWKSARDARPDIRWRGVAVAACGVIFAFIPPTSLFGSFDVMSVSWPFMLVAGLICRESAQDAHPEPLAPAAEAHA